ncbi:uncharacterized protein LOC125178983, partial [Hyalella azteca]|uniref:Uncharacterized protein LOC125178983 n=1 Tax=Hyalella azteca TaxID=294128 RepID=A0A979FTJ3_HYAAZ
MADDFRKSRETSLSQQKSLEHLHHGRGLGDHDDDVGFSTSYGSRDEVFVKNEECTKDLSLERSTVNVSDEIKGNESQENSASANSLENNEITELRIDSQLAATSACSSTSNASPTDVGSKVCSPPSAAAGMGCSAGGSGSCYQRDVKRKARLSLSAASRLLRRTIPQSGHLMLPRRLWMQTVPTQGCEVVIQFGAGADDAAVSWLAARLRARLPELVLTIKTTSTSSRAIYLCASVDGLVKGAEDLRLLKKTKAEYGSGRREVTSSDLSIFE